MRLAVTRADIPAGIRRQLARLRWARVAWVAVDTLAAVCVAVTVFVAGSLLLDRTFRFDAAQRAVVLGMAVVAMALAAWRRLIRPLGRSLSDEALARVVEARHGCLGESLLAAVQFSRMANPEAVGYSPAMVQAAVDLGLRQAAGVDFLQALNRRRRNRNLLAAAGAIAVLAVAGFVAPGTMGLWLQRNVLLADVAWPQDTHLEVVGARDGAIVCPRGDDLAVRVHADPDGVVPSVVVVDYRQAGGASGSETMVLVGNDAFRTVFRNVLDPFRLRARGGDAVTPWHDVRLVQRPGVQDLAFIYTPPSYVGQEPHALPKNVGSYPVLEGSRVEVVGTAGKDLARARLSFAKAAPADMDLDGARGFRTVLSGDRLRSGVYAVWLEDTTGLASKQPARFSLRVNPDRRPTVNARLEGIGDLVVPDAVVPIRATMRDDYAIRKAELVCKVLVEEQGETAARRYAFGGPDLPYGDKQIEAVHRQECGPLDLPVGARLTLGVEAADNDTVSGPKVGASGVFSLKVVTEDELRAELLRREQEQRLEFERLLRDQRKLAENARTLQAVLDAPARTFADEDGRLLATTEKRQRLVGGRCTAVADQMTRILAEVENNRLEQEQKPLRDRLAGKIIEPLRLLARRNVLMAADHLDQARKAEADAPGDRRAALADAIAEQDRIVAAMRDVLRNMVKWEGYQEAVTLLREVLRTQKGVSEKTLKAYQERIRSIFDE